MSIYTAKTKQIYTGLDIVSRALFDNDIEKHHSISIIIFQSSKEFRWVKCYMGGGNVLSYKRPGVEMR